MTAGQDGKINYWQEGNIIRVVDGSQYGGINSLVQTFNG